MIMADTTDIEKKSLEAHVELCAERYRFLEEKLETMESKITGMHQAIREIHDGVMSFSEKRNSQIMAFGVGLTATLLGIIGWLLTNYVFK